MNTINMTPWALVTQVKSAFCYTEIPEIAEHQLYVCRLKVTLD